MPDTDPRAQPLPSDVVQYRLPGGWTVLAGKTDDANEYLSLTLARPNDLWFHIHGMSGSHVLLRARTGAAPDRSTIDCAAGIAAYHSKARSAGTVSVSCTEARHVAKPRGAKRGTVTIKQEKMLKVRPMTADALASWRRAPGGDEDHG